MAETYDREKIIDCMFDPITSLILASLEDGKKESLFLAKQVSISNSEVLERLSYLIEHEFILKSFENDKCFLEANPDKLNEIVENNNNFDSAINSLEKMDSYLN